MKQYRFKFSVIIPIYNVQEYLEEAIESVLKQTIGFKENIQIILVNDGSKDNSEDICLKYKRLYPQNIMYIKQENAGVSVARNHGLEYAQGEFINFLDGDDKWEKYFFEKAYKMFLENEDIDIIGVKQKFFEARNDFHVLGYKFNKDKIINILKKYDHIQFSVTSAFVRYNSIEGIRFDVNLKYSEDLKFLSEIVIKKCTLGLIASSLHLYRKRVSETSALQTKLYNSIWYVETLELCYKYLFELSKEKFGAVIDYFQYGVMYDYQWRIKEIIPDVISEQVIEKYMIITKELLQDIDDEMILEQKFLSREYKIKLLEIKHGKDFIEKLKYRKSVLYFEGEKCIDLNNENMLNITVMNFFDDKIVLKGLLNIIISNSNALFVINGLLNAFLSLILVSFISNFIFSLPFTTA